MYSYPQLASTYIYRLLYQNKKKYKKNIYKKKENNNNNNKYIDFPKKKKGLFMYHMFYLILSYHVIMHIDLLLLSDS